MWLGLFSMQNFFGYALIAPFAGAGDSGKVLGLRQPVVPLVVAAVVTILTVAVVALGIAL